MLPPSIGINDHGVTVGFWSTQNTASMTNNNFAFYWLDGRFHDVNFPVSDNASPPVNQLLGVSNNGIAVGFYANNGGLNRGYEYNIRTNRFTRVEIPGGGGAPGRASPLPASTTTVTSSGSSPFPAADGRQRTAAPPPARSGLSWRLAFGGQVQPERDDPRWEASGI